MKGHTRKGSVKGTHSGLRRHWQTDRHKQRLRRSVKNIFVSVCFGVMVSCCLCCSSLFCMFLLCTCLLYFFYFCTVSIGVIKNDYYRRNGSSNCRHRNGAESESLLTRTHARTHAQTEREIGREIKSSAVLMRSLGRELGWFPHLPCTHTCPINQSINQSINQCIGVGEIRDVWRHATDRCAAKIMATPTPYIFELSFFIRKK